MREKLRACGETWSYALVLREVADVVSALLYSVTTPRSEDGGEGGLIRPKLLLAGLTFACPPDRAKAAYTHRQREAPN